MRKLKTKERVLEELQGKGATLIVKDGVVQQTIEDELEYIHRSDGSTSGRDSECCFARGGAVYRFESTMQGSIKLFSVTNEVQLLTELSQRLAALEKDFKNLVERTVGLAREDL